MKTKYIAVSDIYHQIEVCSTFGSLPSIDPRKLSALNLNIAVKASGAYIDQHFLMKICKIALE